MRLLIEAVMFGVLVSTLVAVTLMAREQQKHASRLRVLEDEAGLSGVTNVHRLPWRIVAQTRWERCKVWVVGKWKGWRE